MNVSTNLGLLSVPNLRDLGGMVTEDGHIIKKGILYRSGHLGDVTSEDLEVIKGLNINRVYDFRSDEEMAEKPDVIADGCSYIHIPTMRDASLGISKDSDSDEKTMAQVVKMFSVEPDMGLKLLTSSYEKFITDDYSIDQYRAFLGDVFETVNKSDGAVLWHCTLGKDRAGFASCLIEEILGVDHESIIDDYLYTNTFTLFEAKRMIDDMHTRFTSEQAIKIRPLMDKMMYDFSVANKIYLESCYSAINERFGSFERYLEVGLGIDDRKKEIFRSILLKDA